MYAEVKNETSLSGITELNVTYDQATDKFTLSASKSGSEVEVDSILTLFFKDVSTGAVGSTIYVTSDSSVDVVNTDVDITIGAVEY